MRRSRSLLVVFAAALCAAFSLDPAAAQDGAAGSSAVGTALQAAASVPAPGGGNTGPGASGVVGIYEKLGNRVPLDLEFRDENGVRIRLGQLVTVPTILALVYYKCPNVCDLLLTGIAGMIRGLDAEPGRDYRVVTVSIDETETPSDARHAKTISLETIERPFPPEDWRFLTGDRPEIAALADAVGFRFARRDGGFDHPVCLIFLSPDGKLTHYIYGADFLPADVKLSLLGARSGAIAPSIASLLRFCFRTDPASHRMVFDMLRVAASATLSLAFAFVVFLLVTGRRRRKKAAARKARAASGTRAPSHR